jgi:hypothetical protein
MKGDRIMDPPGNRVGHSMATRLLDPPLTTVAGNPRSAGVSDRIDPAVVRGP